MFDMTSLLFMGHQLYQFTHWVFQIYNCMHAPECSVRSDIFLGLFISCGHFGFWPIRCLVISVCCWFSLRPFRFVAFSDCGRFGRGHVGVWPVTGEFATKKASNAENVFIWWRHHGSIPFLAHKPWLSIPEWNLNGFNRSDILATWSEIWNASHDFWKSTIGLLQSCTKPLVYSVSHMKNTCW